MTYAALAGLFLLPPLAVTALAVLRRRPDARWWAATGLTAAALVLLTIVFDSLMVAADLFRYDETQLSGLRLGLAPVEDLAWPLAAAMLLPSLHLLLTPRERP